MHPAGCNAAVQQPWMLAAVPALRPCPPARAAAPAQSRLQAGAAAVPALLDPPARQPDCPANGVAATPAQQPAADAAVAAVGHVPRMATLLIQCPDKKGVVAALAQLLYGFGCNILESDQYTDQEANTYFQRIRFDYGDMLVGAGNTKVLERGIAELSQRYAMEWRIAYDAHVKQVAILVSKLDHCLYDLLIRYKAGELNCQFPIIISNHADLEHIAQTFGVPFRHVPMLSRDAAGKAAQEAEIERILLEKSVDLIVMARYMQVLSADFCARHAEHTINIHHSFLPAFEGARPYHRAHARGVKIIGATAHFATAELDAGPIIEQDVARITHRDGVADMIRKGRDLERMVFSRAVRWVLEDRVMVDRATNRTVVMI